MTPCLKQPARACGIAGQAAAAARKGGGRGAALHKEVMSTQAWDGGGVQGRFYRWSFGCFFSVMYRVRGHFKKDREKIWWKTDM